MTFAAVLGLAGAGIGLFGQMSAANTAAEMAYAQMAQQERMFAKQMDMQMLNFGMAQDARRDQQEYNEYLRQMEQMNRMLSQQERAFDISEQYWLRGQQTEERQTMLNRQVQVDRDAARQQAMQIEQMLRNQQLTQQERQFAVDQLREAQAIARGERDEDLMRFYQEREQRAMERNFQVAQYNQMRQQAALERNTELDRRNRVTGQIDNLRDALAFAYGQMGDMPDRPGITREDIDADARRREDIYMSDVDRAADRVASVNEADLMRRGMDQSTTATARRGEITERIAQEYNRARERARDEALRYITGVQGTLFNEYNAAMGERGQTLQEVGSVFGSGIDQMLQMRDLPSALMNDYLNLQSGVYNRDILSAGGARGPVDIGSAVYDRMLPGSSMGPTLNYPSVTSTGVVQRSGVFNPAQLNLPDPTAYMNIASLIGNNMLSNQTSLTNNMFTRADNASRGVGGAFDSFMKQLGGFNWGFNNSTNGAQTQSTGHMLPFSSSS